MSCDGGNSFQKSHLLPSSFQIIQLRDILRSNTFPQQAVASSLQRVTEESSLELARYDAEILRLEETLAKLRSDRNALELYSGECRSVFSPVRRLPIELLIEIFDLCSPPGSDIVSDTTTQTEELDRIAKKHLLHLSQVCFSWYGVVMGTPRLWSTIVVDTTLWPPAPTMLLNLVASSLQRGGEFPLDLRVAVDPDHPDGHPILELLSRHSRRWKNVHMWLHPRSFNFLVGAKGNLPLLECLTLENATKSDAHYVDDIFEVAPRLNDVSLAGWLSKLPAIPWDQILDFRFENKESPALPLGMLRLLSTHTRTELLINASEITGPLEFPPVTSHISTFIITFTAASASSTRLTLGKILGCLTLPSLSKLRVACEDIQPLWNQTRFLDFATRSSLCNTLTSFEIDVMLDAPELLECISVLPLLEDLYLWDCDSQGNYRAIITDDLLYQLTWRDNQTNLVPRLNFVGLNSLMQFSDASLWDFVTSRIVPGRSAEGPFGAAVAYLLCCCREFSPEFIAQLSALEDAEEMEFHISSVRASEE